MRLTLTLEMTLTLTLAVASSYDALAYFPPPVVLWPCLTRGVNESISMCNREFVSCAYVRATPTVGISLDVVYTFFTVSNTPATSSTEVANTQDLKAA